MTGRFRSDSVTLPPSRCRKIPLRGLDFWAGNPHTAVPVAREDKMRGPVTEHVRAGGHVAMTGTVRLLETVGAVDPLWDRITPAERADVLAAKVYIAANAVRVLH